MCNILIYFIIGAIISILTSLYYTSKWSDRKIEEGSIIIYLVFCTILWPIVLVILFINIIKFVVKRY